MIRVISQETGRILRQGADVQKTLRRQRCYNQRRMPGVAPGAGSGTVASPLPEERCDGRDFAARQARANVTD